MLPRSQKKKRKGAVVRILPVQEIGQWQNSSDGSKLNFVLYCFQCPLTLWYSHKHSPPRRWVCSCRLLSWNSTIVQHCIHIGIAIGSSQLVVWNARSVELICL